jgi:hypothetical protein
MDAALGIRGAFALEDREELRALVSVAAFRTIRVRIDSQMIRYPSLDEFVPGYLSATPVAGIIGQAGSTDSCSDSPRGQDIAATLCG